MRYFIVVLIILATQSLALVSLASAAPSQKNIYIQVRETRLRTQPEFWAPTVKVLSYGDFLTPLGAAQNNKSWLKAQLGGEQGYVHVSAVTSRKIVLASSRNTDAVRASSSEIVLAGKGFNKQVENHYKSSKGLDFAGVDEVEQLKIDPVEQVMFLQAGELPHN